MATAKNLIILSMQLFLLAPNYPNVSRASNPILYSQNTPSLHPFKVLLFVRAHCQTEGSSCWWSPTENLIIQLSMQLFLLAPKHPELPSILVPNLAFYDWYSLSGMRSNTIHHLLEDLTKASTFGLPST